MHGYDSHAETLTQEGHMDRVLRHAISEGLNPMTAIQMMTINSAEHFGLTKEMGMIASGRWADVVLVEDLMNFKADDGDCQRTGHCRERRVAGQIAFGEYPNWVTKSIHLKQNSQGGGFCPSDESS